MASRELADTGGPATRDAEDSYGQHKRLDFVTEVITTRNARRILDVGCGTGAHLTAPLARRFPRAQFVGLDSDPGTLAYARTSHPLDNLAFAVPGDDAAGGQFELIVASEVLEHVEQPEAFLEDLRKRLAPNGRILLTVPNGYGPSEFASFVQAVLVSSGLFGVLRFFWRGLKRMHVSLRARTQTVMVPESDTLADSPHISFFSYKAVERVIAAAGLRIEKYRARMFLCGFGLSNIVAGLGLVRWNLDVAERLPRSLVSDWMFVLVPDQADPAQRRRYHRGGFARLRRRLNERVWGAR